MELFWGFICICKLSRYVEGNNIEIPEDALKEGPFTEIFILEAGNLIGMVRLADQIRESSYEAVQKLKDRGIMVKMLTGDNQKTAEYVSNELGLTDFFAEILPDEKQKKVAEIQVIMPLPFHWQQVYWQELEL
jgi:Cu2+-exporting ATPase